MRFNYPDQNHLKTLKNLVKKVYKENFFDFVKRLGQRTFVINNEEMSYVVVVNYEEEKIQFLYGYYGLICCHNMFSAHEQGILRFDLDYNSIEALTLDEAEGILSATNYNYNYYTNKDKILVYTSQKSGELEGPINEKECYHMIEALQYLFHIKTAFDLGDETIDLNTNDEIIIMFDFDDENLTYESHYVKLNSFNFLPSIAKPKRVDPKIIDALKDLKVTPGTSNIGMAFSEWGENTYKFQNGMKTCLKPVVAYWSNEENQVYDFEIYEDLHVNQKRRLKDAVINLFKRNGLHDTIITDHLEIYQMFYKSFKKLGIDLEFNVANDYSGFLLAILATTLKIRSFDFLKETLNYCKDNYELLLSELRNQQFSDDDEDDDLDFDEFDDDFFESLKDNDLIDIINNKIEAKNDDEKTDDEDLKLSNEDKDFIFGDDHKHSKLVS